MNLGNRYTCVDYAIGPFMATYGTTTPLIAFNEMGITYLAATNPRWLPYLADEGVQYMHYSAHKVRRQFGLDQDIPNAFTLILDTTTSVCPFLHPSAFEFWSKFFTAITILSSLKVGLCTAQMHGY